MQGAWMPPAPPRVPALTGLRWWAALLVFAYHVHLFMPGWYPARVFDIGLTGVSFFFVLSGFVLAWSHRPDTPRAFLQRRFARVWPAHAVTWLVALPLLPLLDEQFRPGGAAANLLLVQGWLPGSGALHMTPPSWSLSCEAAFYLAFPLLVRLFARWPSRIRIAVAAAGVVGAGTVAFAG